MKTYDIVLLTESRYDQPIEIDWYVEQVLTEDNLVKEALEAKGLRVTRKDWADANFDWSSTHYVLFRTTWDYFHRFEEFSKWMEATKQITQFINPVEQIIWNMDKHYLRDLNNKGVNIPPTVFIEKGNTKSLQEIHNIKQWTETVLKPAVSGGGRHTYRLNQENIAEHEDIFKELCEQEAMLLQPFQHNVVSQGEIAFMVMGGKFTHAILKIAKEGDFRVQDDFGGTVHEYNPTSEEIAFAEKVVAACDPQPLYARVDVFTDNDGNPAIAELELIEPELWFRFCHESADVLADAIVNYVDLKVAQ